MCHLVPKLCAEGLLSYHTYTEFCMPRSASHCVRLGNADMVCPDHHVSIWQALQAREPLEMVTRTSFYQL